MTQAALDDLVVLDFSRVLAGPLATMVLGDLGARVIKVERPGTGDDTRQWGPPHDAAGEATYFLSVNRNKDSVVLDLADERDLARARALAAGADVVVENFRSGLMEDLGLGYEELRAANPGLVYCSITGFGHGSGADLPGYDLLVQALGGLMSLTGEPDGAPQKVGVALVDVLAGLFASTGILAALRHRDRTALAAAAARSPPAGSPPPAVTDPPAEAGPDDAALPGTGAHARRHGEGQRVDVSLLGALLGGLVNQASAYAAGGVVGRRMGNAHPSISPYELYAAGEGALVLAVGNDRQFTALCEVIGRADLATDARFATNAARVGAREALEAELLAAFSRRPAAAWVADLTAARVPAGEVQDVAGAFALAERLELEPVVLTPRADGSTVPTVRSPIGLSATPPTYRSAPPPLGG